MKLRQASLAVILLTVFIDMVGIGIVIPVLPKLIEGRMGECSPHLCRRAVRRSCADLLALLFALRTPEDRGFAAGSAVGAG